MDSNDTFFDRHWFCSHSGTEFETDYSDPVENDEPCPVCGKEEIEEV